MNTRSMVKAIDESSICQRLKGNWVTGNAGGEISEGIFHALGIALAQENLPVISHITMRQYTQTRLTQHLLSPMLRRPSFPLIKSSLKEQDC